MKERLSRFVRPVFDVIVQAAYDREASGKHRGQGQPDRRPDRRRPVREVRSDRKDADDELVETFAGIRFQITDGHACTPGPIQKPVRKSVRKIRGGRT